MTGVTVRAATPADAEDVVRINVRGWQRAYAGILPDDVLEALDARIPERVTRLRQQFAAPGDPPWHTAVAVTPDAGTIGFVTYGHCRVNGHDDTERDPTLGEVLAIYVDPAQQGRGAGRALLDTAVGALRDQERVTEVRLWVFAENAPARAFYERYGFYPDGATHLYRVHRTDGTPVEVPEVRYALRCH
ncbi:MAG TPA: N-acetyltransferase [Natronosporangium sp.]